MAGDSSLQSDQPQGHDFHARAQEARRLAEHTNDRALKQELLILADLWERLSGMDRLKGPKN
jgi:hypothetical protein